MKDLIDLAAYPPARFENAPSAERTRALLFLTGDAKLRERLERHDDRIRHHAVLTSKTWLGAHLRVEFAVDLYLAGMVGRHQPILFQVAAGQIARILPDDVLRLISTGAIGSLRNVTDVTDEIPRTQAFLLLRRRDTGETIRIPADVTVDAMLPVGPPEMRLVTPRFTVVLTLTWQEAQALVSRRYERFSVVDSCGLRTVRRLPTLTRRTLGKPAGAQATLALSAGPSATTAEA